MLKRGSSSKTLSSNVARERRAGRSAKQAVAIAYSEARKTAKPIATHFGRGCYVKLVKVGREYEVIVKCPGRAAKVFRQHDAWIAKQQYADFVKKLTHGERL